SLSQPEPSYAGSHFVYRDVVVDPCAVQAHVPIWVGGRTGRSLRRALALADGWAPFGLSLSPLAAMLGRVDLPPSFELGLSPDRALDPMDAPDAAASVVRSL